MPTALRAATTIGASDELPWARGEFVRLSTWNQHFPVRPKGPIQLVH